MSDQQRNIPISGLDADFMTIDPAWGKEVTHELNEALSEAEINAEVIIDENGNRVIKKRHLWGLLSYYTRDMRLGNINTELYIYSQKYLDFAGDCLREGYIQSFLCALSRVITCLELSQSRGGFLRRRNNTITNEQIGMNPLDPPKSSLFGGKTKGGKNNDNR